MKDGAECGNILTLPGGGGAYLAPPPLTFLFVASKRMYMLVRNF